MEDVLELTPGSIADRANLLLQKLEKALYNEGVSGLLIGDNEVAALLEHVNDLQAEIMSLRFTYEHEEAKDESKE